MPRQRLVCRSLLYLFVFLNIVGANLVDYIVDKLTLSMEEEDSLWAASVEKGRCMMNADDDDAVEGTPLSPLPQLLARLATSDLHTCVPTLLFDPSLPMAGTRDDIHAILSSFPIPRLLGRLDQSTAPSWLPQPEFFEPSHPSSGHWKDVVGKHDMKCRDYMVIIDDVMGAANLIESMTKERVIIVSRSPLWRIRDFLSGPRARTILNLMVIQDRNWRRTDPRQGFLDLNLLTHRIFGDSLGGSFPQILTSWRCDGFTRPWVKMFPMKMTEGFSGHQFKVATVDSPPFVYKTVTTNMDSAWDGFEVRILQLLAGVLNFTLDFREPVLEEHDRTGITASARVVREVLTGNAEVGAGGVYITTERLELIESVQQHTQDCASFMTLASVALPRYRAIFGPFHWTVWLAISTAYVLAIIPLVFSHSLSLGVLIRHPTQIENMFWYVFGTFTNSFTFRGQDTWVGSTRDSTRMIIGWYWAFSIIVTACYTGSVISFIAFPTFPSLVENMYQLLSGGYRVGTLNSGGWSTWFLNSSDPKTDRLLKNIDLVPTVWEGIQNMTHASFFHPYAFLGSRHYLDFVVTTNYSAENKRSLVHIGEECFVPFWVTLIFPRTAVYAERLNHILLRSAQSGLLDYHKRNVRWETQKSTSGALLQASSGSSLRLPPPEERMLTLDDTQGMFLLFGGGVALALFALSMENVIGRVSSLRKHCQPGPRRRSSAGLRNEDWISCAPTSASSVRPRPQGSALLAHRNCRLSISSLPGVMISNPGLRSRSSSIATAPPLILTLSPKRRQTDIDVVDSANALQIPDEEDEQGYTEGGMGRSLSIFSWVSALAAKLKERRRLKRDAALNQSSHADVPVPIAGETTPPSRNSEHPSERTFIVKESDAGGGGKVSAHVESVFGSWQELHDERLLSLDLLRPLEQMEAEEEAGNLDDGNVSVVEVEVQPPTPYSSPVVHRRRPSTARSRESIPQ